MENLLSETPPRLRRPSSISAAARPKGRILVVDDELALLHMYGRVLGAAGYAVVEASDGVAARKLLATERFDAILSDILMPGIDGLELLREVRRHDSDVPVVFATGAPTEQGAHDAVENGALLYLVKPVDRRTLLQVLDHACQMHRVAQHKREALARSDHGGGSAGLAVAFARALASIRIVYQPIVDWPGRQIFGHEALLRSAEPLLPDPGALLDAAERLDRVGELARAIHARIAAKLSELPEGPLVFVNIHPRDLADDELFAEGAPLTRHARRVVLEITERAPIDSVPDVQARVAALRARGFRIAIDDIGAGYAGLCSFATLQPEIVKLDMSLVRDIHLEPVKRKLVASMLSLCREMGCRTIAEGVETPEERHALAGLGCELMQGYLFARPGDAFPGVAW